MGCFITFEGGEGSGKSTQAKRLCRHLLSKGMNVIQTREPGGTPEAELLRELLVRGEPGRWSADAEMLLNYAARDHHLRHLIRPSLAKGIWVVCDRFMDSTRAYQCNAGGGSEKLLDELEQSVVAETRPDLTLVFDINPSVGLSRAASRGEHGADRFERKGMAFHEKLRKGFLAIAAREPARCKIVDAEQDEDEVFAAVIGHVSELTRG